MKKSGKSSKPILDKFIEDNIFEWISNVRSMGFPITNQLIVTRANFIVKEMKHHTKCTFSAGWIRHFKERYNIVKRKAGSKLIREDDADLITLTNFVKKLIKESILVSIHQ